MSCCRSSILIDSYLKLLCPLSYVVIVLAYVPRVEVGEGIGVLRIDPDLAQHAGIDVAHENLADGVKTVSLPQLAFEGYSLEWWVRLTDVHAEDLTIVLKGVPAEVLVVFVIVPEGFAEQILNHCKLTSV